LNKEHQAVWIFLYTKKCLQLANMTINDDATS